MDQSIDTDEETQHNFDELTSNKAADLAKPILDAGLTYKIHIVKDHDMKERVCLEVERLGVNVVIMGSRGFGAAKSNHKARLGSVSDYCVHHCDCPVVVVRFPEEEREGDERNDMLEKLPEHDEGEEGDDDDEWHDVHVDDRQEKPADADHVIFEDASSQQK
jgi:hypothetical protein